MTSYRQLYDPYTSTYYAIDGKSLVFRISSDESKKETRLKPYFSEILVALFKSHPQPLSYEMMTNILRNNKLVCPDETRLHRKVSELRSFLSKFYPGMSHFICNTRGVGYSLPLHLKDPEESSVGDVYKIRNRVIRSIVSSFEEYVKESLTLSGKCSIVKSDEGFVLQRKSVHSEVESLLLQYDKQKKKLEAELKLHKADFISIRMDFIFAKLKTYIGLARISEFSISKEQWLEWHELEARRIVEDLVHQVKRVEL